MNRIFIAFTILFLSSCRDNNIKNKTIEEVAGSDDVARFMKNFEGRGDLSDTTHSLTATESLAQFKVPADLAIELVLSEPQVTQPVFITFDPQGRLWVVQYNQYPYPEGLKVVGMDQHIRAKFDKAPAAPPSNERGADKITMFEDTDGNGTFDKSTDVISGLNLITSVALGRGQIWVLNPPYLLAYPDPDHNGIPDGAPVVHLKGFGIEDTHAVANNLRFGPDGWLYGAQGSTCTADVSSEKSKNVKFNGQAVWRYHPIKKVFEVFAEGGGNTFDVEIDEKGRIFSGDNGTSRGQYYKQGAYFIRNLGKHGDFTNPFSFGYLNNMALQGEEYRFTHAFVKYNGNNLPEKYSGKMIAVNPLQSFVQLTRFEQNGSTLKTIDEERLVQTPDHWFRPVDITAAPDGNVYIADWYDSRISHVDPRDTWDKNSGRIYRLTNPGSTAKADHVNLTSLTDAQLVQQLSNKNIWFRQQALSLLYDRKSTAILPQLQTNLQSGDAQLALESLWAINAAGGFTSSIANTALHHPDPFVRMWAVRLAEDNKLVSNYDSLIAVAKVEQNAEVRSQLASTAKRLPGEAAVKLIQSLLNRDDTTDPDIPLQLWWAVESVCETKRNELIALFNEKSTWQNNVVQHTILNRLVQRYIISGGEENVAACAKLFRQAPSEKHASILFNGLQEGLRGKEIGELSPILSDAIKPYKHLFADETLAIELRTGKKESVDKALKIVADNSASLPDRLKYIRILGEINQPESVPVLLEVVESNAPNSAKQSALLALQRYDNKEIGERVVKAYPDRLRTDYDVRESALALFASRPSWATLLISAIVRETKPGEDFIAHSIDRSDVPEHIVRQMKLLGNSELTKQCQTIWPETNSSSPEQKNRVISAVTSLMSQKGDANAGHPLFIAKCGTCHKLFNEGRTIAPDLTGYDRKNLRDLLTNIVDPSAYIREGYETWHVVTENGRTAIGTLRSRTNNSVTLQPFTGESVTIPVGEIKTIEKMDTSMMPERLLDGMTEKQVRDFFSYLMK